MTKRQKKEAQMLLRAEDWAEGRAADFATAKPAVLAKYTATLAKLTQAIADLGGKVAIQSGGDFHEETAGQRVLRTDVEATLRLFNRSAASIAEEKRDPSILDRFRMPTGGSDEDLRAKLRAFATAIEELALADEFEALDHADTAADLRKMADDFVSSEGGQGGALAKRVGATEAIPVVLREGRAAVKTFNAMFSNRYETNVELLAAWKSASHLNRDGAPEEPEPSATPPAPPA